MRLAALGGALALLAMPGVARAAPAVLVVGDSLEVGTGPHLRGPDVEVDASTGRTSTDGVRLLRERLREPHRVVVFDLGTNDDVTQPGLLAASLRAARALAGDRCMVVASLNRPPLNGVTVDGLDGVVRTFAAATGAELVDWRGYAAANPEVLSADGLHATPAGYEARARLVRAGIERCLGGGPAAPKPRRPSRRAAPEPQTVRPAHPSPRPRPRRIELSALAESPVAAPLLAYLSHSARVLDSTAVSLAAVFRPTPEPVLGAPGG